MKKIDLFVKRVVSLSLVLVLLITSVIPAYAKEEINGTLDTNDQTEIIGTFTQNSNERLFETGIVRGHLTRSGDTTNVDLILSWNGDFQVKGFRFTKLQVTGTSLLNPTIYHTMFTGDYMTFTSYTFSNHLYVTIARISIPTSVTKAKINVSALYVLTTDGWLSGILTDATVTIN